MKSSLTVALAGNPNCGKTTIFNHLTGSRQHVGNYPGITVDKKYGEAHIEGESVHIVDLPGTYSLTAYSQEEVVARRMLADERPDVVLQVVDSGALERNLYLTVQLMELGIPVVLALNMMDEVRKRGDSIDVKRLSQSLGVPVVETVGRSGEGVTEALRAAVQLAKERHGKPWTPLEISYGPDLDVALQSMTPEVQEALRAGPEGIAALFPARWVALKYLESDLEIRKQGTLPQALSTKLDATCAAVAKHLSDTMQSYPEAIIADYRYGYITGLLRGDVVLRHANIDERRNFSDMVDTVLTHKLLGPLIMIGIFYVIYQIAFSLGSYPMDLVEDLFGWMGGAVSDILDDGLLKSLLVAGVIKGAGGVLTFVPLILIMFLLIAFLEDSGYMARIAYMLDRVFRLFGLHGSSVMPYIISGGIAGGCAVPGVMATRTLRSPKEKLATILTVPFMACGAKIPVFTLLVAAFFVESQRATIMLLVTLTGWAIALLSARILRSTIITGDPTPFVMELPPYRLPTLRGLLLHTWERGWQYIKKAGTIILAISILLWAAMTFPGLPDDQQKHFAELRAPLEEQVKRAEEAVGAAEKAGGEAVPAPAAAADKASAAKDEEGKEKRVPKTPEEKDLAEAKEALDEVKNKEASAALRHSIAGRIGTALEPVSKYAGFEWRTNIALLGGFAAKEVLVSTLGTAYSLGEVDPEQAQSLEEQIKADPHWNKANALSLLIFVLIYAPCVVTIVAMKAETGGWGWPIFSLAFSTALAYGLAVAVYQIGRTLLSL